MSTAVSSAQRRSRLTLVLSVGFLLATLPPLGAAHAEIVSGTQQELEAQLLAAVQSAHFENAIDFGPFEDVCPGAHFCPVPAPTVSQRPEKVPNVDVAVIELDAKGNATRAADVLLSRDYPKAVVVPIDQASGPAGSWGVSAVRWRRWDIDRYNGGTWDQHTGAQLSVKGWTDNPPLTGDDDIIPGRQSAPLQFMAPYPASLFKLIVAFRIMRLVDMGRVSLDQLYSWDPTATIEAQGNVPDLPFHAGSSPAHDTETKAVRDWMDAMVTYSDNDSARALLKLLWDLNDLPAMHDELRALGLGTLQINGTDPATGRLWYPGQIHMTSMDTARLLWLVDGGDGTLWTRPDGTPVRASLLSNSSRAYLKSLLGDYAFNEALSTSNFCGAPNTRPGIPALVPSRWVNADGTVTAGGYPYGHDVRPCQATAGVTFAHKTGLTFNYGSDAGIVRSLPGKQGRHYVISFISSLGYRYVDPVFASATSYPCYESVGAICYTQRIPALGKQVDDYLKATP